MVGGYQLENELTLELNMGDKIGVGWDGVDGGLFAEVPQTNGIVIASSGHMIAIGTEIHGQNTLQMAIQQHQTATRAKVPHTTT